MDFTTTRLPMRLAAAQQPSANAPPPPPSTLLDLPLELRLEILSLSLPETIAIPAHEYPCSLLHGPTPIARVCQQLRTEVRLLPHRPTVAVSLQLDDLDRQIGRRRVEERNWFRRVRVYGVKPGSEGEVESRLRECWMLVKRRETSSSAEDNGKDVAVARARASLDSGYVSTTESEVGAETTTSSSKDGEDEEKTIALDFDVEGACTIWSHYPWYMQAGYGDRVFFGFC
jgi:hypothetical protein